ncbi:hypothetical protein P9112_010576 [Eukaryota sp. TZLM1-RC]
MSNAVNLPTTNDAAFLARIWSSDISATGQTSFVVKSFPSDFNLCYAPYKGAAKFFPDELLTFYFRDDEAVSEYSLKKPIYLPHITALGLIEFIAEHFESTAKTKNPSLEPEHPTCNIKSTINQQKLEANFRLSSSRLVKSRKKHYYKSLSRYYQDAIQLATRSSTTTKFASD